MLYARWNDSHKAFDSDVKKSVYELNDENMPVAYKNFKQNTDKSDWTMVSFNKVDYTYNLLAMVK